MEDRKNHCYDQESKCHMSPSYFVGTCACGCVVCKTSRAHINKVWEAMDWERKFEDIVMNPTHEKLQSFVSQVEKETEQRVSEDIVTREDMYVSCGRLQGFPDGFKGGCGEPINLMKVYACVDCSAPFHRKCLLKHIHEDMAVTSLTKMPIEDAFKKIDEMNHEK